MATEEAAAAEGGALAMGAVVVGTALDVSGLRRHARTHLKAAAKAAGADAGSALAEGMSGAAEAG
ncbi:MAG TPA: hypothetical protein VK358_09305, partial [Longimicrobium sp.]|nr:hypothetical protein [Longimicrobium sp.]